MPKYKLDLQGKYLPFPGYTVICKLNLDEGFNTWCNIYNTLACNKNITDFYSILPLSSWHVTAINLFTQEAVERRDKQWDVYVASKQHFFNKLGQALQQNQITPTIAYSDLYTNGALQIDVALDEQSSDRIHALAKHYKYEESIPSQFHVTLGYQYKSLDDTQVSALKSELAPRIQAYLSDVLQTLQPAQLCYFNDMLAFTPLEPGACVPPTATAISMFSRPTHATQDDESSTQTEALKSSESPKST